MEDIVAPFTCEKQEPARHFLDFTYAGSVGQVHAYDQFTKGQPFYTTPLAAPVQDDPDEQVIRERDEAEAIADALAEKIAAITGCEIGEHTSANSPWHSALDAADEFLASRPPEAPVQEPVAWIRQGDLERLPFTQPTVDDFESGIAGGQQLMKTILSPKPHNYYGQIPLYTAQRQWVGLTQQDIDIAFDDTQEGGGFDEFARAIEVKLKEKNT